MLRQSNFFLRREVRDCRVQWGLRRQHQFSSRRSVIQLAKARGVTLEEHLNEWGLKRLLLTWLPSLDTHVLFSVTRAANSVKGYRLDYMPPHPDEEAWLGWDYESTPIPKYVRRTTPSPVATMMRAISRMQRVCYCRRLFVFAYAQGTSYHPHHQNLEDIGVNCVVVGKGKNVAEMKIRQHMYVMGGAGILPNAVGIISNDAGFIVDFMLMRRIYGYKVGLLYRHDPGLDTKMAVDEEKRMRMHAYWAQPATVDELHTLVAKVLGWT